MIQELQNLRGHQHCILLVSHREEFADAFPDGYKTEEEKPHDSRREIHDQDKRQSSNHSVFCLDRVFYLR
jgi:hypothetical protein